jgi:Zn-dependent protease with chaperone function
MLALASVVVAASTLLVAAILAFTWIAQLPEVVELGPWSAASLRARTPVPAAVAAAAAAVGVASVVNAVRLLTSRALALRETRRACTGLRHADGLIVVDNDRPDAFSTPPPGGRIVVSTGLLRALPSAERRAMLAHEASHLAHGHAWWVIAADLAAAVNPILIPTGRAVQHGVERWADEDAAAQTGDRHLVARTVARSALLIHAGRVLTPTLGAATRAGRFPPRSFSRWCWPPAAPPRWYNSTPTTSSTTPVSPPPGTITRTG